MDTEVLLNTLLLLILEHYSIKIVSLVVLVTRKAMSNLMKRGYIPDNGLFCIDWLGRVHKSDTGEIFKSLNNMKDVIGHIFPQLSFA
jgi:hypothetical protein